METVKLGSRGSAVTHLQQTLRALGYPLSADGVFGAGTDKAVRDYQTQRGLTADGIVGPGTWRELQKVPGVATSLPLPSPIPDVLLRAKTAPRYRGDYHMIFFAVRNRHDPHADTFNDTIGVYYTVDSFWHSETWPGTTDPGRSERTAPQNDAGVAALVEDTYEDCWQIGMHRSQYEALTQCAPVRVYRDRNKDGSLDLNPASIQTGLFGINIHRASKTGTTTSVGPYSAGCLVVNQDKALQRVLYYAKLQKEKTGRSTYTVVLV